MPTKSTSNVLGFFCLSFALSNHKLSTGYKQPICLPLETWGFLAILHVDNYLLEL